LLESLYKMRKILTRDSTFETRLKGACVGLTLCLAALAQQACTQDEPKKAMAGPEAAPVEKQGENGEGENVVSGRVVRSRTNAITEAVEKVSDAICGINVTQIRERRRSLYYDDPFFRYFFPDRIPRQAVKSFGSGFLVSEDGFILTNEHVVHNAAEIVVVLPDGSTHDAEVVGEDYITESLTLNISPTRSKLN